MTKKQIAIAAAAGLTALAAVLTQCPDEAPTPAPHVGAAIDAGSK
jgi:hypothetical protein